MPRQLTLRVGLSDHASFENYLADGNNETVSAIRQFGQDGTGQLFIFGDHGAGKTHLLYAAQRDALSKGVRAAYLSMADPDVVENIASFLDLGELVCVDDLDIVAGDPQMEKLLFNLIEQQKETGGRLLLAARGSLTTSGVELPDLLSRLKSGASYHLRVLDDDHKQEAMRLRAQHRGFELSDEVVAYVMTRFPRDTSALFGLLDRIDQASLSTQRKVTIPLVKGLEKNQE